MVNLLYAMPNFAIPRHVNINMLIAILINTYHGNAGAPSVGNQSCFFSYIFKPHIVFVNVKEAELLANEEYKIYKVSIIVAYVSQKKSIT